jgi:PAS domain S-box-containing protein
MNSPPPHAAYRAERVTLCRNGVRTANAIGLLLTPFLVLLDRRIAPGAFPVLLHVRIGVFLVFALIEWLLETRWGREHPRALGMTGACANGLGALVLSLATGGFASPYNSGVGLTILCTALLVPWSTAWTALLSVVLLAAWFARGLFVPIDDGRAVFGQFFVLGATGTIAIVSTAIRERLQARAFRQRWALAEAYREKSESEARKAAILTAALDCIIVIDADGRITEFNPAAECTFGYRREEALGRVMAELIIPEALRARHRSAFARHLETGKSTLLGRRVEVSAMRANGSEFPAELTLTRQDLDGRPSFTAYLRDITARREAEEALRASRQRVEDEAHIAAALLRVTESLGAHLDRPDMLERVGELTVEALACDWATIFVWDEPRQAFRLHSSVGMRPELSAELAQLEFGRGSLPIVQLLRPSDLIELEASASASLVPREIMDHFEAASALVAPISRRAELVGALIVGDRTRAGPFSAKQRRLALGIAHSTSLALANARLIADLQTASRLKSEFVSTMSHELRTPLHVILGFSEMARDPATPDGERAQYLDRIEGAGRDLLELIESTLEIGKLEAGREEVRLQPVALPTFWSALERGCAVLPRRPDVSLEWSRGVPEVAVVTDPGKLAVVIRNLVGNALKFTEQGWVRVSVELDADAVLIRVADTGIGIHNEDQETIFEMFRQADGSDTRRYGGTGLGLYIVRRFVDQLGGSVTLESTPGRGSVFSVVLPRPEEAPPARRAA